MTKVVVQNGNIDGALKKFKVKVAKSGVPSELKKRKCYEKRKLPNAVFRACPIAHRLCYDEL